MSDSDNRFAPGSDEELLQDAYFWLALLRKQGYRVAPVMKRIAQRIGTSDELGRDYNDEGVI